MCHKTLKNKHFMLSYLHSLSGNLCPVNLTDMFSILFNNSRKICKPKLKNCFRHIEKACLFPYHYQPKKRTYSLEENKKVSTLSQYQQNSLQVKMAFILKISPDFKPILYLCCSVSYCIKNCVQFPNNHYVHSLG